MRVGSLNQRKDDPTKFILKVELKEGQELILKNGDAIFLDSPESYFVGLAKAGHIDQSVAEEKANKTPSFVRFIAQAARNLVRGK
jgi:hypothetical protein